MPVANALNKLAGKAGELSQSLNVTWKIAPQAPADPLSATIDPAWPDWRMGGWKNFQDNWIYAQVTLPQTVAGVPCAGSPLMFIINGWLPFTLWIDGREIFKEEHNWKGTGPIAQPLLLPFKAGGPYRLAAKITPTDAPIDQQFSVEFRSQGAMEMHTCLAAAANELKLAARLVKGDAERRKLARAARMIDLEAIEKQDYPRVLQSIAAFEKAANWLSARAKALKVHVLGHSHLDMDWLWTWEDTVRCIRRDFKAITDLMDDNPEVTFTHSQVPTYQVALEQAPAVFEKVRQRMAEGRWENAAATWVEGDLNMADGESIARHFLYARQWTRANLGNIARVLWEPDTFGHPGNMPQLARLGECDTYFHMRCNPAKNTHWPVRIWKGIDGTRMTTFSLGYSGSILPDNLIDNACLSWDLGLKNALHLWGLGDHGGGLQRWQLDLLKLYRDKPLIPTIRFGTLGGLFEAVRKEGVKLPHNSGEEPSLFPGCFTTHARTKQLNRQCETALLTAEALCAIAGQDRRAELRDAWTRMLFNHFHDIFDGAAVHASDLMAHERFEHSLTTARQVTADALEALVRPAASGGSLTLVNPLGFARSEIVRAKLPEGAACLIDSDGRAVPVQKCDREFMFLAQNVPAFSTRTYRIAARLPRGVRLENIAVRRTGDRPSSSADPNTFQVDLKHARVHISRATGAVNGWFDKRLDHEFVPRGLPVLLEHAHATRQDQALGVFQLLDEGPNSMSAWLIHDIQRQENLLSALSVELLDCGPVFVRFRVQHAIRDSRIEQLITLYNDLPRADFQTTIDWRQTGSPRTGVPQLKVSFGTGLSAATARFEGPFTIVRRPTNGQELPTQKFLDVQDDGAGYTLYNDGQYGCDVRGAAARITLLRNTYHPDPQSDNGVHTIRYAFEPHDGRRTNAQCVRGGMAFNRPMLTGLTSAPPAAGKPMLRIDGGDSIVCTSLRRAEYSDRLLVRLFETSGRRATATLAMAKPIEEAREVNFLENPTGKATLKAGRLSIRMRPFEVKTLAVKLSPVVLAGRSRAKHA